MDADVDHDGARADVPGRKEVFAARGGDEDVRAPGDFGQATRPGMAHGHRRVAVDQKEREGPADEPAAADHDHFAALDRNLVDVQKVDDAFRRAWHESGPAGGKPPEIFGMEAIDVLERLYPLQRFFLVERSEERRVGKEWRSRWSPYH